MTTAATATPRQRTTLSNVAGIMLLLLSVPAGAPAVAEMRMASEHSHPISHPDIVLISVVGFAWALVAGVSLLRKATTARWMLIPGLLGLAAGLAGIAVNIGTILTSGSPSDRAEHGMYLAITMFPGLAGVGHILEARGRATRIPYVASVILPLLALAAFIARAR